MESKFTGSTFGLLGINILFVLLSLVTLGIGIPFAVCMKEKWTVRHTIIEGRQLKFDGNGAQLIGKYICWLLLTIITLGIYSFFLAIKMKKWVVYHTHFAN